jgi:hypothetical protein
MSSCGETFPNVFTCPLVPFFPPFLSHDKVWVFVIVDSFSEICYAKVFLSVPQVEQPAR